VNLKKTTPYSTLAQVELAEHSNRGINTTPTSLGGWDVSGFLITPGRNT